MNTHTQKNQKKQAQAMVEFALALPILLILVLGLMETGRLLFIYASTVSAAREAVRYGAAMGKNPSNVYFYQDCAGIRKAAKNVAFINSFNDADIQITYDGGLDDSSGTEIPLSPANPSCGSYSGIKNGDRIKVVVSTQWQPIVSLVPLKAFTITASSKRTVIKSIPISLAPPAGSPPAAPVLVSPVEGAYANPGSITFSWNASSGATDYWFEYSGTTSGNSGWITSTSYKVTTLSEGIYSWHVKARNSKGEESPWGSNPSRSLNIATAPAAPTLVSPIDGGTKSPGTITFEWNTSNGATEYLLEYSNSITFSPKLDSTWISGTSSPVTLSEGTYYWRVLAKNAMGTSEPSTIRTLIVKTVPLHSIFLGVSPVEKSVTPKAGDTIPFTYTISNNGSQQETGISLVSGNNLTGIVLVSGSCPNPITLDVGQTLSCNANRVVTQTEIDAGTPLKNTWIARGSLAPDSNAIDTTITIQQNKAISISNLTGVLSADESKIIYTYTIKNTGYVTLHDPKVTDTRGTTITCLSLTGAVVGTVAPNETITCSGQILKTSYTSIELAAGIITITGTATENYGGTTVTDIKSITVDLSKSPTCDGTKKVTVDGPSYNSNGKIGTWTIKNSTGSKLTITSISFTWKAGKELNEVSLSISPQSWSVTGLTNTSGSIAYNAASNPAITGLIISTGNTSLATTFKNKDSGAKNLAITFSNPGCGTLKK
jgi:Flp pilus assembly protein TadG